MGILRSMLSDKTETTRGHCLDFIETAHRGRVYPFVYCHITLHGEIDTARLTEAVRVSSLYVPEILFAYDFGRGQFVDKGLTADGVILTGSHVFGWGWRWDLSTGPQLRIEITQEAGKSSVLIGISHILSDGAGFLQYLYLLAALYNGDPVPCELANVREVGPILSAVQVGPVTQQERNGKRDDAQKLSLAGSGELYQSLAVTLDTEVLKAIQAKVKRMGATLNDIFLAAYARVVAREWNVNRVLLPCPADLRHFRPRPDALTVANMTGIYRLAVELQPQHRLTEILKQVQIEMNLQKTRRRCFSGIAFLHCVSPKTPIPLLEYLCRKYYHVLPISYTNFGAIDAGRLHFKNSAVEKCFLSGTYRAAPDFQLSISTFQGVCTLNSNMIGSAERIDKGQYILDRVKSELIAWTQEQ